MGKPSTDNSQRLFSSRRERRLWIWTAVVVATIYATLGVARTLAVALGESGWGEWLFMLGCLLILIAVVTQGLTARPSGVEIGVAIGIAAVYLMVFARMSVPAERTHIIEYGVVAVLTYEALSERRRNGRDVPVPALLAIILTAALGAVDETIQALIPSRVFAWVDILFNSLAAFMAVTACAMLRRARRMASRASAGRT